MSYTPTTWVTGDTITATKLNKMEQGIANAGGGALICNTSYVGGDYILDKTAQEIYDALLVGTPVYIQYQYGTIEDYSGTLYLAPVIRFSNYDYTNDLKIYASRPSYALVQNVPAAGSPGVLVYIADGLDAYPIYDNSRTTVVVNSSLDRIGIG